MLCSRPVEAPARLMDAASGQPPALTLVVGADHAVALASAKAATEAGLIEPLLLGAPARIAALAEEAHWDIAGFQVIPAEGETALAEAATEAAADPALQIIMKGQIHTDALMAALLKREAGIRTGRRLSHVFHMTVPGHDDPLLISDGALNVAPDAKTFEAIAGNLVTLCHRIAIPRPRIACLSATEEPLAQMPSSIAAGALADWANGQGWSADFAGPMAFDNAVSPQAA
ncbi:MAG: phosphate acyltransferase, partial [Pseudomonadota bacterium]